MKILILSLLALPHVLFSGEIPISAKDIHFIYRQDEGVSFPCRHRLIDPRSQDWEVICGEGSRKYLVHLWITRYDKPVEPKLALEILYWVTDQSDARESKGFGTSLLMNLKDATELDSLSLRQSVENDTAGLYLRFGKWDLVK